MDEDEDDKMGFEDSWKRKARSQGTSFLDV